MTNEEIIKKFNDYLRLKNRTADTIGNYLSIAKKFLYGLDCDLSDVTKDGVEFYILQCKSRSSMAQTHSVLKLLFANVLQREEVVKFLPYPAKTDHIPDVYSIQEIEKLIAATDNLKHKLLILLQYDCGLRVSELTGIEFRHIDRFRMVIKIESGKGQKGRLVPFSQTTLTLMEAYFRSLQEKPRKWLFEGQNKERYSTRSIQQINNAAKARAGITKKGCTHILRHAFGTHLLEQGYDLAKLGVRMGHNSPKTTLIYTRMTADFIGSQLTPAKNLNIDYSQSFKLAKVA